MKRSYLIKYDFLLDICFSLSEGCDGGISCSGVSAYSFKWRADFQVVLSEAPSVFQCRLCALLWVEVCEEGDRCTEGSLPGACSPCSVKVSSGGVNSDARGCGSWCLAQETDYYSWIGISAADSILSTTPCVITCMLAHGTLTCDSAWQKL